MNLRFYHICAAILGLAAPLHAFPVVPHPPVTITRGTAAGTYVMSWQGLANYSYFIQTTLNASTGPWVYVPCIRFGTGATLTCGFSSTEPRTCARLRYTDAAVTGGNPDSADFDGDTISNITELNNGTDPFLADTDGDGMNDNKEPGLGFNPRLRDSDGDGLEDPWETLTTPQLIVSEYQASNKSTVADEDGENKDWMEILNATASPVSLNGWYLTDKPGGVAGDVPELTKWQFPNGITLAPGETLLVWASNKNRKVVGQPLHTNFELSATNDGAGIVNSQGGLVDSHRWTSLQVEDRSAGWGIDNYVGAADGRARKLRFFGVPTPRALNTERAYLGVCGKPEFSIPGGIFTGNPFPVTITVPAGTTGRYTTDFTIPTATSSAVSGPITVSGNTIIRVSVTAPNCLSSPVITRSFLFKEKVLGTAPQGTLPTNHQIKPATYPDGTSQAPYTIDYAMDPAIIRDNKNALLTQLSAIPTVSVVLPAPKFFNLADDGIYANASVSDGPGDWTRDASVEFIGLTPDARDQENGTLSITGASSIDPSTTPKHSMKVEFTKKTASNLEGVMNFDQPPFSGSLLKKFRTLMLRNPTHDSWLYRPGGWLREESTYIKEAWARSTHAGMGGATSYLVAHRRWVHLYVDGLYWGIYELSERVNEDFMRAYNGSAQQYDVLTQNGPENGDQVAWDALKARVEASVAAPNDAGKWTAVTEMLDVDNYIDYLMVNMYMHNEDWAGWAAGNNWRAARRKDLDPVGGYATGANAQRFRFFIWDAEYSMRHAAVNSDMTGASVGPAQFHGLMLGHSTYKSRWKSRVVTHFNSPASVFGIAAGSVHNSVTRFTTEADTFDLSILCESARWGDGASAPGAPVPAYTRADWLVDKDYIRLNWMAPRRSNFLNHLRARGLAD